jgi:hypothetical protein
MRRLRTAIAAASSSEGDDEVELIFRRKVAEWQLKR